ncbi:hypothetical protein [Halobacteriaceae bacterium SHR40]|uniref:hypothetical protein n=1 Tax=Halovenus amylolytica TaxID=2500550 RepID=UPI000FE35267
MTGAGSIDSIDEDIALAFGLFALTDAEIHEAASAADVTRWELEEAIERAGMSELFDLDEDKDASETIDDLFEDDH